jgi:hypothetical protein
VLGAGAAFDLDVFGCRRSPAYGHRAGYGFQLFVRFHAPRL